MSICSARRSNGESCKGQAIQGGNVCRVHGGSAPQVRRKAAERLAALVDPAIAVLAAAMRQTNDKRLALSAAVDVLNRNNLSGKHQLEVISGPSVAEILRQRVEKLGSDGSAETTG